MPRFAANNVAELELGTVNRNGKVLSPIAKYSLRLSRMDASGNSKDVL
jgi:hypothetical protein